MSVSFRIDMSEWTEALHAISGPGMETIAKLEEVMAEAFAESQAIVHVITGSLKGSGRTSFKVEGDQWTGEISYGGPSPGFPHDPVDYAGYEQERGGSHDFLRNTDLIHSDLEDALFESMRVRMRAR